MWSPFVAMAAVDEDDILTMTTTFSSHGLLSECDPVRMTMFFSGVIDILWWCWWWRCTADASYRFEAETKWSRFCSDVSLQWRHNERDGVSNHQPHDCSLNRLFRRRSRKHKSSALLAFVRGIHRWPVNSPHKVPGTRKIFPFDDVIILLWCWWWWCTADASYRFEAETKLSRFCSNVFKIIFAGNVLYCDSNFTHVYSYGSI